MNPYSVQGFEAAAVGVGAWVVDGVSGFIVSPAEFGREGAVEAFVEVAGDSVGHRAALLEDGLYGPGSGFRARGSLRRKVCPEPGEAFA